MTDVTRRKFIERLFCGFSALPFLPHSHVAATAPFSLCPNDCCHHSRPSIPGFPPAEDLQALRQCSVARVPTRESVGAPVERGASERNKNGTAPNDVSLSDASRLPASGPTFSLMLWGFFRGKSTPEKLRLLHRAGFRAFEFTDWHREDLETLTMTIRELGLTLNCINGNGGVAGPSNKSPLDSRHRREFIAEVTASLAAVRKLNGRALIILTGNALPHLSRHRQRQNCIAALKEVAPLAHEANVILLLEPLNIRVDHPGYFLVHSDEAFEIIDQVNSPSVKLLFDVYHQQISEGNVIATITKNITRIGHFHIADVPGRHEPGTGEINYVNVLQAIVQSGYRGFIGLEFIPSRDDFLVLEQVKELGRRAGIQ